MLDQAELIWGIFLPPVLMAMGLLLLGTSTAARRCCSLGLWLGIMYSICHIGLRKWPAFGVNVHDWPAWLAIIAGALTWCGKCHGGPWVLRLLTRGVIVGAALWLMLGTLLKRMEVGEAIMVAGSYGVVWLAIIMLWEHAYQRASQGITTTGLVIISLMSSVSLLLFNTMLHAQLAGIITAMLFTIMIITWWRPTWLSDRSIVTVVAFIIPALLLLGVHYAHLPWWGGGLLLVAGISPLLTSVPWMLARTPIQRIVLQGAAMAIIAAPVLMWGIITTMRAMAEPDYGY